MTFMRELRPFFQETLHPWSHCCCQLWEISQGFKVNQMASHKSMGRKRADLPVPGSGLAGSLRLARSLGARSSCHGVHWPRE